LRQPAQPVNGGPVERPRPPQGVSSPPHSTSPIATDTAIARRAYPVRTVGHAVFSARLDLVVRPQAKGGGMTFLFRMCGREGDDLGDYQTAVPGP